MTIWVLTTEYNEYDQYGAYFIHAWDHKPDRDELREALKTDNWKPSSDLVTHVLDGGGREKDEYQWYNLEKVR